MRESRKKETTISQLVRIPGSGELGSTMSSTDAKRAVTDPFKFVNEFDPGRSVDTGPTPSQPRFCLGVLVGLLYVCDRSVLARFTVVVGL